MFFPLWFGVPVMVVLGGWGLGLAVRRAEVVMDPDGGILVFRVGLLARRVRLASVTAVQVDGAKVSVASRARHRPRRLQWLRGRARGG